MIEIQYPINGFNNAHEVIEEATRTGIPIADLIGKGLPADWSQEQLAEAYLRGECSKGYLAARLKVDRLEVRRLLQLSSIGFLRKGRRQRHKNLL